MPNATEDIQSWNRIAGAYTQVIGAPGDRIYGLFKPVLWDALGDLRGRAVLDVGCGHGWLAAEMHAAGAAVIGVDGASALLDQARQRCPQAEFIEWDLAGGLPPLPRRFPRILAHMVLMDIPELAALLAGVRAALADGGRFIFTITHPCFFNQKSYPDPTTGQMACHVTGYLQPETWHIDNFGGHRHYHRSLTDYFEALRAAGLAVTRLYEPPQIGPEAPPEDFRRTIPKFVLIEAASLQ